MNREQIRASKKAEQKIKTKKRIAYLKSKKGAPLCQKNLKLK